MTRYHVTLTYEGTNVKQVAKKAKEFFGGDADVAVEKVVNPTSRSDRLDSANTDLENCKSEVTALKDELQEWLDNLPENLQQGTKADELQDAISDLEELESNLENVDWPDVTFPGMF